MTAKNCRPPGGDNVGSTPGKRRVFSKTIKLKNGRILHAHEYGLDAFSFEVDVK